MRAAKHIGLILLAWCKDEKKVEKISLKKSSKGQ
jgi:hypothetical protein